MVRSILVPLDLGADADRALPVADALAHRIGAELHTVVVSSPGVPPSDAEAEARAHARRAGGITLDQAIVRFDDDVVEGVLAQRDTDDALLCCASHGHGPIAARLAGSISDRIERRSDQPVLIVGPFVPTEPGPRLDALLVVVDDRAVDHGIAAVALEWAVRLDADAHILQVVTSISRYSARHDHPAAQRVSEYLQQAGADANWEVVQDRDLGRVVLGHAAGLGEPLIVMACHRHGPDASRAVIRNAPCPVLVVPRPHHRHRHSHAAG